MQKGLILVLVIALAVIGVFYFINREEKPAATPLPQATGNIDDAVDAILQEIIDEQSAIGDGKEDVDLITSDSQEVSGFNQSVDENEL